MNIHRFQASGGKWDAKNAAQVAAVAVDMARDDAEGTVELARLREEIDLPVTKPTRAVAQLEDAGAIAILPGGEIAPRQDLSLKKVVEVVGAAKARGHEWADSRLDMMRGYAEQSGRRRGFLPAYFGQHLPGACGNCDNYRGAPSSEAVQVAPETTAQAVSPPNRWKRNRLQSERVWSTKPGRGGQVLRYDDDKIVVVFDEIGYKTLAVALVVGNGLLVQE